MVARRLNDEQVKAIRENLRDTNKKLAEVYGVSPSTIKRVRNGELYKLSQDFDGERKKYGW